MSNISIIRKPEWVSWDEIHNVLVVAHEENRNNGVIVAYSIQEGEKIQNIIENSGGVMFVALDGDKVVGTAGVELKMMNEWYYHGIVAFYVFDSLLPGYQGLGIYKELMSARNDWAKEKVTIIVSATHYRNKRVLDIWKKIGYKRVWFRAASDHYNVFGAKWISGECPYPGFYICLRYYIAMFYTLIRYRIDPQKGRIKRFGI